MSIPTEAIEAAARAIYRSVNIGHAIEKGWDEVKPNYQSSYRRDATAALTAALPLIEARAKAEALREAADDFRNCPDWGFRATRPMATEDYLRARADQLEGKSE